MTTAGRPGGLEIVTPATDHRWRHHHCAAIYIVATLSITPTPVSHKDKADPNIELKGLKFLQSLVSAPTSE